MTGIVFTTDDRTWMRVEESSAVGGIRRAAVGLGTEAGLPESALADLAIIASEISTNLARHADEGTVLLRITRHGDHAGVEIIAIDRGPGIPDVASASRDGHSTAGTLGIGLGAIARKATSFDIYSQVGTGTVLAATLWNQPAPPPAWTAGLSRPISGEEVCGDSYVAREVEGRRQIMLCDGLGHGPLAAISAQAAVTEFLSAPPGGPRDLLEHIHGRIQHTRGVVAGVAELDLTRGVLRFAGIGNISGTAIDGGRRRAMVSLPGIVGHQRRDTREFEHPLSAGTVVVLHSDGLTDRWDLPSYPGLVTHVPIVIAATLLRDAARRRDDAAVLVARAS